MSATERTPLLQDGAPDASGSTTRAPSIIEAAPKRASPSEVEEGEAQAPHTEPSVKPFRELLLTVAPMALGTFLASMDGTIVLSSYASIGDELNELQRTSWVSTGYMLTLASFQPLYGKMSDIFGRKPCLMFAYVIFSIGCLACGYARNMTELIAARAFAGIGGGGMQTLVSIIMSDLVPLRSRGTWQGILNLVWATGMAVGAPLGGVLADSIGWRWSFIAQAPLAIVALILVGYALRLPQPEAAHWKDRLKRIDFGGAFTLVIALCALLLAMDRGGNVAWDDTITVVALIIFGLFFSTFVLVEMRLAKEPFAPKRIVANHTLAAAYLCNFFCVAGGVCLIFYVSLYVQAVLHRSAAEAGSALIPGIIAGVIGSLAGGYIMQVTGRYWVLTVLSYALMLGGQILVSLSTGIIGHSFVGLEIGLFIMSLGNGSGITTTLIALIHQAGATDQAIATAVSYLFRSLGSVLGISVGSTIFQERLRHLLKSGLTDGNVDEIVRRVRETLAYIDELPADTREIVFASYAGAVETVFTFCTVLAVCAVICSFFIKEKHLDHK
ncbi:unnamed protein product [Peniophora sp. CBMAI 1063]|nr:unnamed protein product [Peniophora sp. CBMAI 1063]